MSFLNEYISEKDAIKFNIEELNSRPIWGKNHSTDWTIDRERNIYLRRVGGGHGEFRLVALWDFYWKDELIEIKTETVQSDIQSGECVGVVRRLSRIKVSKEKESLKAEIISDLADSFQARRDGCARSTAPSFTHTLQFEELI